MSRRLPSLLVTVSALLVGACAGPTVDAELTVRDQPVDVLYGDQSPPPRPPVPPAADPRPASPGFIAPPAPRPRPPTPTTSITTTTTTAPPVACPELAIDAAPVDVAASGITGPAPEGPIPYRVSSVATVGEETTTIDTEEIRTVGPTTEVVPGVEEFDVSIDRDGVVTTTTFLVDRRGVDDGVFISQIVTTDDTSVDAFTPAQPVKILPLPAALQTEWSSGGIDPLTGVGMVIHGRITGKETINACGTALDSWTTTVGAEPNTGEPSRIVAADRNVVITGTLSIATQFGGLVVASDLRLEGRQSGTDVVIDEAATANERPGVGA